MIMFTGSIPPLAISGRCHGQPGSQRFGRWSALLAGCSLLALAPALAAEPVAGQSYFGATRYVEYMAGDLPIVIAVPHGGRLTPDTLPKRKDGVSVTDSNTQELAKALAEELRAKTAGHAYVILSHLQRSRLDPNREIMEAAQGHEAAEAAWREFHGRIEAALTAAVARYGFAFFIDLHGHAHPIARLELGYGVSAAQLNRDDAALDADGLAKKSSLRDLHAAKGGSGAALLRGPASLGARLSELGLRAVPSPADPGPGNNPYFSGGYTMQRHAAAQETTKVDGLQIETPRVGVRDTAANRARFARITAEALLIFLRENYGFDPARKH